MENPASWTPAEKVISRAITKYHELHREGHIGISIVRMVADDLRAHSMLIEPKESDENP